MRLEHHEVPLSDGRVTRTTSIIDDEDVARKEVRRSEFLRMLADNVMMTGAFERMSIFHDGKSWVAEVSISFRR